MFWDHLAAGLMTYAVHSTLLLGAALLVAKCTVAKSPALAENALRIALFGGLITAALHTGLALEPLAGSKSMFQEDAVAVPSNATPRAESAVIAAGSVPLVTRSSSEPFPQPTADLPSSTMPAIATNIGGQFSISRLIIFAWLLIAALLCGRFLISWVLFFYRIKDRAPVRDETLRLELAGALAGNRPIGTVRLTVSAQLRSPVAFGFIRPEVCIPQQVLTTDSAYRKNLLAHEAGHLLGRDPLWLAIYRVLECFFFFQPLNFLANKRLQEVSEFRCDFFAARQTGRPLDLARCLTEVASWHVRPAKSLPVPGMTGSGLSRRIHRLLEFSRNVQSPCPQWFWPVAMILVLAFLAVAPGFSVAKPAISKTTTVQPNTVAFADPKPEAAPAPSAKISVRSPSGPAPEIAPVLATAPLPEARLRIPVATQPRKPQPATLSEIDLEDQIDHLIEDFESAMELAFEDLEDRLDAAADAADDRYQDRMLLTWRGDFMEDMFDSFEDRVDNLSDYYEDRLDDLATRWMAHYNDNPSDAMTRLHEDLKSWSHQYQAQLSQLETEFLQLKRKVQ